MRLKYYYLKLYKKWLINTKLIENKNIIVICIIMHLNKIRKYYKNIININIEQKPNLFELFI